MYNNEAELIQALKNMLKYVHTSYHQHFTLAVMIPAAQALRNQADAIELKDKEIQEAKALIERIERSHT